MPNRVHFHRIGSDPELLFVRAWQASNGTKVELIPADYVVGRDKDARLRSWIGTDGHAQTGELRPAPCQSVYWHLCKIGDALGEIKARLPWHANKMKVDEIHCIAQPNLKRETMGGHIWISLWYDSPLSAVVVNGAGYIHDQNSYGGLTHSRQTYINNGQWEVKYLIGDGTAVNTSTLERYKNLAKQGKELTVDECWRKVHYLCGPLETAFFWGARAERDGNVSDPYVRLPSVNGPDAPNIVKPHSAYFRFEYRYPSTWLGSPTLAYSFLGLAKLAMLNWSLLPSHESGKENQHSSLYQATCQSWSTKEEAGEVLLTRLSTILNDPNCRLSADLRDLGKAVTACLKFKPKWPMFIDFDGWNNLSSSKAA